MSTRILLSFLIGGMVVGLITPACAAKDWLATGKVTKIDGSTFFFLGKNSRIYTIDAASSQVLFKDLSTDYYSLQVGDKVRVFGRLTDPHTVRAARVRVFDRELEKSPVHKEIKVIVEQPLQPLMIGAGPEEVVQDQCRPQPCPWEGQGLISDFNWRARQVKLQTSEGNYTVNVGRALVTDNRVQIGVGLLNVGDAVVVQGVMVDQHEIDARRLTVKRTHTEAEGALPQHVVSIIGLIENIDYPSHTFRMSTAGPQIIVLADENTTIWSRFCPLAFTELRPGIRVKVRGVGSLGAGYSARNIQVIGTAP